MDTTIFSISSAYDHKWISNSFRGIILSTAILYIVIALVEFFLPFKKQITLI
jgi:hypothetical protein